jgi:hypothetical protein
MRSHINRRDTLVGAASLPAISIPAVAASDPIYAAIEEHRRLFAVRGVTLESNDDWDSPEVMAASEAEWQAADRLLNHAQPQLLGWPHYCAIFTSSKENTPIRFGVARMARGARRKMAVSGRSCSTVERRKLWKPSGKDENPSSLLIN